MIDCRNCPIRNCPGLRPPDESQLEQIAAFKSGEIGLERGESVLEEGVATRQLYTVLDGVLLRFRTLSDGRRQIVNFMFPGDMVGLQAAFDGPASHSVEALLPSRLCVFERDKFRALIGSDPTLGYDMIWLAAKEETALESHIVSLGQKSAAERIAYLAVWLLHRAIGTCLADRDNRISLPVTQAQIADMLGLSLVHTNRTLKALERDGLVVWRPGDIMVPDMELAKDFAHFHDRYEGPRPYV